MAAPIGLAGPSYAKQTYMADCQRTMDWFPEVIESQRGISALSLEPTPGLLTFSNQTATSGAGALCRGLYVASSTLLIGVFGADVYTFTTAGVGTKVGTVSNDGLPVWICANLALQGFILSNSIGYVIQAGTVTQIVDPDFLTSIAALMLDSYIVALNTADQQFQISASNDVTAWDALEFATIEADVDDQVSMVGDRKEIWFFGRKKTLIYFDSGNLDFPIEPRQGGVIECGCAARFTPRRIGRRVMWLAQDENGYGSLMMADGYSPVRIEDHAFEAWLRTYPVISDAVAFCQLDRGHYFYFLWFPTANRTWVYDITSKMMHERSYFNPITGLREAHRASCSVAFAGKLIVGDRQNPVLWEMSATTLTDNGDRIHRERICPHILKPSRTSDSVVHQYLRVIADVGVGLAVSAGVAGYDPQLTLEISDDGGKTYDDTRSESLGKLGEYGTTIEYRNLGSCESSRVYKLTCDEPVYVRLVEAFVGIA